MPLVRRLVVCFPTRRSGFELGSVHVGFVVNNVALGQVFSKYFDFPCQFAFHRLLHTHHHLSSGARTIGQTAADTPRGLSITPWEKLNNHNFVIHNNHNFVSLNDRNLNHYPCHCDLPALTVSAGASLTSMNTQRNQDRSCCRSVHGGSSGMVLRRLLSHTLFGPGVRSVLFWPARRRESHSLEEAPLKIVPIVSVSLRVSASCPHASQCRQLIYMTSAFLKFAH
jgi:hypothetical protein